MSREVVVVAGARTAIGDYGGALKDYSTTKLGAIAIKAAVERAKIDPATVGHVVMGSVIHGEAKDMYMARVAAVEAGIPVGTPCLTVNRLCGSGLQSIVSAAQHLLLGDCDVVVAGGAESMSRAAYFLPAGRWGQRMGDAAIVDAMTGALHDPFGHGHMGVTAENIAAKYGFTREQQDEFAVASHKKSSQAIEREYFKDQIVPIELKTKKGMEKFVTDEHVRKDVSQADMAKLKTVFKKDGTVTAGNASGINDAGAAVVLMEMNSCKRQNLKPIARLVAYAHAGVEPQVMGLGPIPAVRKVFEKAGLKPADMDVIESNEAFAVQAMAVTKDLGLDPAKVNPNGGAVALGHPIGATGTILTIKALAELERIKKRYALVTMCIGGGQGIAAIFENLIQRKPKIGLALGSGASRGWAHIGAIRALEERGVKPDIICGTSIGALVGAFYAANELDQLEKWVTSLAWTTVLRLMDVSWRGGLIRGERLFTLFRTTFEDRDISELGVPFGAVATELASGREVWLREGSVLDAARASCAVPGLFRPVVRNDTLLVDGGLVNPVPVSMCRALGADLVIAVDLSWGKLGPYRQRGRSKDEHAVAVASDVPGWIGRLKGGLGRHKKGEAAKESLAIPSIFEVFTTALDIVEMKVARSRLAGEPADVLLTPLLPDFRTMEFHRGAEAIAEGHAAVERMAPLLEQVIG